MSDAKFCEYFDVDEKYFPCIDESAINKGVDWTKTYPHETFITLLSKTEKMLGGATNRSLWIQGAYGTGKSMCAYALKRILEVPEKELREYWSRYEPLSHQIPLLESLIGLKKHGVMTAYRYASGGITTPSQFYFAVQESIRSALDCRPGSYKGLNTLKESVVSWLKDSTHRIFVDELLKKPVWKSEFSQSSSEEIIEALSKKSDVSSLMENIFKMASAEGITALSFSSETLCNWIKDVIERNNTKIVFIWDEFSGFFRQNRNSLDEFQKIVSLCQETPFYLVIVTHPMSSIAGAKVSKDDPMSVVMQRYNQVEISLPSNIAFELIGHAFSILEAAKDQWEEVVEYLSSRVPTSSLAVRKAADVKSDDVMRHLLPIHPMAALLLKNIASAFQSNQRSMFDFIKTPKDLDTHAFQWFIQNKSPMGSDRPLLTVDMLWDFFYEKGKEYLSQDIKLILDTYPQQMRLTDNEQIVLKTILIMQAVDMRLGGSIPVLKPTDQNLSYAFEGDYDVYENECCNIAKALVRKGVLILTPIADNKQVYSAAVLAGDSAKIDALKDEIRKSATTAKLLEEGDQLQIALSLTPPLKLRYAMNTDNGALPMVTLATFQKKMDELKTKDIGWHFYAVLAVAKTEEESQVFRNLIKKTIVNEDYKNILVIDALSTPLGLEAFEEYVGYEAMSLYYSGNNNQQSKDNARKAKDVLNRAWKNRIHDGLFTVWSYAFRDGEKASGANAVHTIMQTVVLSRFRYVPDFTKSLTEGQLKRSHLKQVAKYGLGTLPLRGVIAGCEKSVLGKVWHRETYWKDSDTENESISVVKRALDTFISNSFSADGRVSIQEICDYCETEYGYAPSNLTAFIVAFMLKKYQTQPYRSLDAEGNNVPMTPDILSDMIANYYSDKLKPSYIVNLSPEEKEFYEFSKRAWGLGAGDCGTIDRVSSSVQNKMRNLGYPIWTLELTHKSETYNVVKQYISFVQTTDSATAHNIAMSIGKLAIKQPNLAEALVEVLTEDECRKGMEKFLKDIANGKIYTLAEEIGVSHEQILKDVKALFAVKYAAVWERSTGEDEIHKLITEYEFVKRSNAILVNDPRSSKDGIFKAWRAALKFLGISAEAIFRKQPELDKVCSLLLKIENSEDILPETLKTLSDEVALHHVELAHLMQAPDETFRDVYSLYLEGLEADECETVRKSITENMFVLSATQSNVVIKKMVDDYRKGQIKTQLLQLWNEKTGGTKSPRAWSFKYRTPILCCVEAAHYSEAKRAFAILNNTMQSESDIQFALNFCKNTDLFDKLSDEAYRDECFAHTIIGEYRDLLTDLSAVRTWLLNTGADVYDWVDDPRVRETIRKRATAEYEAGGSDEALRTIDSMPIQNLKDWLKQLAIKDMELGLKIISNGKE